MRRVEPFKSIPQPNKIAVSSANLPAESICFNLELQKTTCIDSQVWCYNLSLRSIFIKIITNKRCIEFSLIGFTKDYVFLRSCSTLLFDWTVLLRSEAHFSEKLTKKYNFYHNHRRKWRYGWKNTAREIRGDFLIKFRHVNFAFSNF